MWGDLLLTVFGLAVVLVAGDLLVRGAVAAARAVKIPPLFLGLSIVAFGTSAPELFIAVDAVVNHAPGLALGAITGSTIANILLVLGVPALAFPVSAQAKGLRVHAGALGAATILFILISVSFGGLGAATGGILLASALGYVILLHWHAARTPHDPVLPDSSEFAATAAGRALAFIGAGVVGLPFGAHLLVEHASALASDFGMRTAVVGLSVVALGAALPELATIFAAAAQKRTDVAIGSVIGSSIFNLLVVGGAAGLAGGATYDPISFEVELPVLALSAFTLAAFVFMRRDIGRIAGALMAIAYACFLAVVWISGGGA
jgi:cation:H+ antiporter